MECTITKERWNEYRKTSNKSRIAKQTALAGKGPKPLRPINKPILNRLGEPKSIKFVIVGKKILVEADNK